MGTNANVLVAAPLITDTVNAATGSASTYTPSGGFTHSAAGTEFDLGGTGTGDSVQFPVSMNVEDHACILMSCDVTPQEDLDSDATTQYYFMILGDGVDAQRVYLAHHNNYDGLELQSREASATRITLDDFDLLQGETYTLSVLIQNNATFGTNMAIYVNGRFLRGIEVPEADMPHDVDAFWIGNLNNTNNARPCKSWIKNVLLYTSDTPGALDGDTIWKLYTQGLDTSCVNDPTVYENQKSVVGYSREATGTNRVPHDYDATATRMWGHSNDDVDQVHISDNEGAAWSMFHDFANAAAVRGVKVWKDHVYVSQPGTLQRSSKTSASFSEVLALAGSSSYVLPWCFAVSPDGNYLAVCEYEDQVAADPNRVLITSNGTDWTEIKGLVGSQEHWHSVDWIPDATADGGGVLKVEVGDTHEASYYTADLGATWTTHFAGTGGIVESEEQGIGGVTTADGRVYTASDAASSRGLLRLWDRNPAINPHGWTKINDRLSRVRPITGDMLANVFASYISENGTLWAHAHAESNPGIHSSVWLMHPDSRELVLAEDLGEVTWTRINNYVETPNWIWADVYRFPKTARVDLGLADVVLRGRANLSGLRGRRNIQAIGR